MKKALLIIALTCVVSVINAQKTNLWVKGGATASSFFETYNSNKNMIFGPELGVLIRAQFPHNFGYEAGVFYAGKGAKFNTANVRASLNYAGAYGDVLINFPLVHNDNFFAGAGIFFADALSGKLKYTDSVTSKIIFGDTWKRFDAGIEFKTGYEINNTVTIGAQYGIGLFHVYSSLDPRGRSNKARNSTFALDLAFNLNSLSRKK